MQHNRHVYVDYMEVNSKYDRGACTNREAWISLSKRPMAFFSAEFYFRAATESRYFAKTRLQYISSLPRLGGHNAQERRWDERKTFRTSDHSMFISVHPLSVISFYPLNYPLDRDCIEVDGRIHTRIVLSWFYISRKSINLKIDISNWLSQQAILQLM